MPDTRIGPGKRVTLHFSIALENGSLVDSNFDGSPATFEVGDGNLLPPFEEVLYGLGAGDEASFTMPPEKAFGLPNPENVQLMSRSEFSPELSLEPGLVVSFADAARGELPGVIAAIEDDTVRVDFNHPLAGHTLVFRVSIVSVEPSTAGPV